MAVANSLAAVEAGAGQVECTINGLGERAGNCSLEEVVMALRTRADYYHADTRISAAAARAHQPAGGQRDRHPGAAQQGDRGPERLRPRGGHPPGRHAQGADDLRNHAARGRWLRHDRTGAGQAQRPGGPGQPHPGPRLQPDAPSSSRRVFEAFKILADKKKEIYDADVAALVEQQIRTVPELWSLARYEVSCGTGAAPR